LKSWTLRIAYNHVADFYRIRKGKSLPVISLSEEIKSAHSTEDHSEQLITLLSVGETLTKLSEPQVAVIQLRLVEGFSAAEVAQILGITQQAVDSLLYRAKKSFRKLWIGECRGYKSMMKKDVFTLWEQEGDLERMKLFFNNFGPGLEEKERIKQLAMEKIRLEEKRITQPEESSKWSEIPLSPYKAPETFRERALRAIKSLWWRWQWKFAVPVIALVLIVFLGQGGMNGFLNLPQGMMGKASHSESMPQKAIGSYDMANQASPKSVAPTAPTDSGVGISGIASGAPTANGAAKSKMEGTSSMSIAPPLPQPGPQIPPADEGLPRKITYNINSSLQVEDVNLALDRITQDAKSRGGYVVESSQNQYQNNSSAHVTLKVPTTELEGFRGLLSDYGKVLNEQTTANDITNQYYDADTRLRSLEAQEARYLEILKEAHTVEDILKIESYLGIYGRRLNSLKGNLSSGIMKYPIQRFRLISRRLQTLSISMTLGSQFPGLRPGEQPMMQC
jgi:predicted DNA-binding protein YlxM (UPF0122 family)